SRKVRAGGRAASRSVADSPRPVTALIKTATFGPGAAASCQQPVRIRIEPLIRAGLVLVPVVLHRADSRAAGSHRAGRLSIDDPLDERACVRRRSPWPGHGLVWRKSFARASDPIRHGWKRVGRPNRT